GLGPQALTWAPPYPSPEGRGLNCPPRREGTIFPARRRGGAVGASPRREGTECSPTRRRGGGRLKDWRVSGVSSLISTELAPQDVSGYDDSDASGKPDIINWDRNIVISTQDPDQIRPVWRRRRQIPLTAILGWSLAAVGLGWLLLSALIGLSSAVYRGVQAACPDLVCAVRRPASGSRPQA